MSRASEQAMQLTRGEGTRRAFIARLSACLVLLSTATQGVDTTTVFRRRKARASRCAAQLGSDVVATPVVSFLHDEPYLDPTGRAAPYVAPRGTRSGQPLSELAERTFRSAHPWA